MELAVVVERVKGNTMRWFGYIKILECRVCENNEKEHPMMVWNHQDLECSLLN